MTYRQRAFIEAYFACDWNGTKAARRAGYSGDDDALAVTASKLLRNPKVADAIQARIASMTMGADEVLVRLAEQARGEHGKYLSDDGHVDFARLIADKKQHLVKSIKEGKYGLEVEFYDAQTALVHIGRHFGLFTDNVRVDDWRKELEQAGFDAGDEFEKLVQYYAERIAEDDARRHSGGEAARPSVDAGRGGESRP